MLRESVKGSVCVVCGWRVLCVYVFVCVFLLRLFVYCVYVHEYVLCVLVLLIV